jgi:hypothetical protein
MKIVQETREKHTLRSPEKFGRFHFGREAERRFFFFLTLAMLAMGFLVKAGIW